MLAEYSKYCNGSHLVDVFWEDSIEILPNWKIDSRGSVLSVIKVYLGVERSCRRFPFWPLLCDLMVLGSIKWKKKLLSKWVRKNICLGGLVVLPSLRKCWKFQGVWIKVKYNSSKDQAHFVSHPSPYLIFLNAIVDNWDTVLLVIVSCFRLSWEHLFRKNWKMHALWTVF